MLFRSGLAQNEMKAKPALPERVRSMEGLGVAREAADVFATVRSTVAEFEALRSMAFIWNTTQ